jgi:lipid-A-disaccharide synthase
MRLLISSGDASGDAHSAELVEALRARVGELEVYGLGGHALASAGMEVCVDQRELAVGGLVEVLGVLGVAARALRRLVRRAQETRPDLVVLVDTPEINLPLARRLQPLRRAGVPILYYISPQVWAWRASRARTLARRVDRLAVIFPFERDIYRRTKLPVDFVGHPLVDRMRAVREEWERAGAREALSISPDAPCVALLPGSRRNEIETGLRTHLDAARALGARRPEVQFALAVAPTIDRSWLERAVESAGLPEGFPLRLVGGQTLVLIRAADVALAKPGTGTLEVTLLERPLVTAGRAHPLTASLMRRLVRVPSFTMPNLIAGHPVVPEFLQENAAPERIAEALEELLAGPARELQLERLGAVARRLGEGGASERAAQIAETMVRGTLAAA